MEKLDELIGTITGRIQGLEPNKANDPKDNDQWKKFTDQAEEMRALHTGLMVPKDKLDRDNEAL